MEDCQFSFNRVGWAFVLLLVCHAGCGPSPQSQRADEERNPYYQRAKRAVETRDHQNAAGLYKQALLVNPKLAAAHLEIGLLYDDKLNDPVAAIYHYRQYLELRPDSNKREVVEDFIERAKVTLVSRLPQSPVAEPAEVARLHSENATLVQEKSMLQARLVELERQLAARTPTRIAPTPAPAPAPVVAAPTPTPAPAPAPVRPPPPAPARVVTAPPPPPPPPAPAPAPVVVARAEEPPPEPRSGRLHVVQKGDTLQSLALKYYGTRSAWDRIYQANRDQLPGRDDLRVGQRLVIP